MCGLAGYWLDGNCSFRLMEKAAVAMAAAISRRGPDTSGYWLDQILAWDRLTGA